MTRLATGTVLLLAVLALAACGGSKKSGATATSAARERQAGRHHALGRLHRARARRVQERRRGLRAAAPERQRQRRRRHQRRQDHRGDPRRQRARRRAVVLGRQHRRVLLLRRLDRPQAATSSATTSATTIFPPAPHYYTAVQGQALRAADARRRLRPLLQRGRVQEGRDHAPAEDDLRAHRRREEADRSATPTARSRSSASTRSWASTRTRRRTSGRCSARKWVDAKGKSSARKRPGLGEAAQRGRSSLIDWYGYDKLVKFQAGAGDEFSPQNAFETRQARDERSTASGGRVHRRRAPGAQLRHRAVPGRRRAPGPLRRRLHRRAASSASRRRAKHKEQAWALLKYLTTDTSALAKLSNGLRNVPTTTAAAKSPELKLGPEVRRRS